MKFLLNVGAEKAGTTWLYEYFKSHPDFHSAGKELNVIQRDDLVPTFPELSPAFQKDLNAYFTHFQKLNAVSGDFTHYEGSTENVYRLIKDGFKQYDIDIVPVYIMRDPIKRAWSSWNMLGGGNYDLSPAAYFLACNFLQCKYKETVQALDRVFPNPLYFFFEDFFQQEHVDIICEELEISHFPCSQSIINKGLYTADIPKTFIEKYCLTLKTRDAVNYIFERFNNVPWNIEDYKEITSTT